MDMPTYTLMFSTQIHIYFKCFSTELFVNNLLINFYFILLCLNNYFK
jgi:hypothetical protein